LVPALGRLELKRAYSARNRLRRQSDKGEIKAAGAKVFNEDVQAMDWRAEHYRKPTLIVRGPG